jgi:hypothetical protein
LSYEEANSLSSTSTGFQEVAVLKQLAEFLGAPSSSDSHTWVEKSMILYNEHAGSLLASHRSGILRRHSAPSLEKLQALSNLSGIPPFLFYESAEYCLPTENNPVHHGLSKEYYAYATSPLRRYADLVNQRAIRSILRGDIIFHPVDLTDIDHLNRRQKQAKTFTRDLFFASQLYNPSTDVVSGIVFHNFYDERIRIYKTKVCVPAWKRIITAKSLTNSFELGTTVSIRWFEQPGVHGWKEKLLVRLESIPL